MGEKFWIDGSRDASGTATGWYERDAEGRGMPTTSPYAIDPSTLPSLAYGAGWKNLGSYFQTQDGKYVIPQTENWLQPYNPDTGAPGIQTWVDGNREKGKVANFQTPGTLYNITGLPSHSQLGGQWGQGMVSDTAPTVTDYTAPKDGFLGSDLQGLAIPGMWLGAGGLGALTGGSGGITADSIAAGITGGENAAGAMYGAGATAGGGAAVNPFGLDFGTNSGSLMNFSNVGTGTTPMDLTEFMQSYNPADPFGFATDQAANYFGNPAGFNIGNEFTQFAPTQNLGADAIYNGATTGAESLLGPLTQKIGEQAAKTLIGRMVNGTATADDYATIAGKLGAAALGAFGSNQQAKSLQALAQKYSEYGAPSRARYEASMTPGFDPMSIPGYAGALDTTSKSILAKLSAAGGNPFGNPGGLIDANKQIVAGTALPAVTEYQRLNANTGFGNSMNAAIPFETGAVGQEGNLFNAIGYGLNQVTNKEPTLADMIKSLQIGGLA